jgi:hypothetical protein
MERQGMVGQSTGYWRDARALGVLTPSISASNSASSLAEQQHHDFLYPADPTMPSAMRRTSVTLEGSRSTTPTVYYNGVAGPVPLTSSSSISNTKTLSFPMMSDLPPFAPPVTPRTETVQWAVVRVTNVSSKIHSPVV